MIILKIKMATALEAARARSILEPVWNHAIEHDDMQTPLIPFLSLRRARGAGATRLHPRV